ncbi:MAG: 2-amino-4-hydroxy-6-hydroxymethyldihydropteridine diphosphokinase [Candidatus Omnitrophica bacterium]|nr:2-amino-4-hydroxy-6-hydroxymethyldihydropteridine diphosphokinase [Candidatus Omnitrophota bacterium]
MAHIFLGLGSNLGDREANLSKAIEQLRKLPHTRVIRESRRRETQPEGGPPQGPYLNSAVEIHTELPPLDLMAGLLEIEDVLGRKREGPRWGPRVIDLDLLAYDDLKLEEPNLTIPHPRLHQRRFALEPLTELAPDWKHPGLGRTASELLRALPAQEALDRLKDKDDKIISSKKLKKRLGLK